MLRSFADLKRAAQADILLTIGKGNPDKEKVSDPSKISRALSQKEKGVLYRTCPLKSESIEDSSRLNVQAKEFRPSSTSESSEASLSPNYCNGTRITTEESVISDLQMSLQKLSLNDSSTSVLESCYNLSGNRTRNKNCGNRNYLQKLNNENSLQISNLPFESSQVDNSFSFLGKNARLVEAALKDSSSLRMKDFILISDSMVENVLQNKALSEFIASLSFRILQIDERKYFAQILLNKVKYVVNEVLGSGTADPESFSPFISFLHAFSSEVKLMKKKLRNLLPDADCSLNVLLIQHLGRACLHMLHQKELNLINDIELLIFVIPAMDIDLQTYIPEIKMELIYAARDAFISKRATDQVRLLLMQFIELSSSNWSLSARTIHFYQKHLLKE